MPLPTVKDNYLSLFTPNFKGDAKEPTLFAIEDVLQTRIPILDANLAKKGLSFGGVVNIDVFATFMSPIMAWFTLSTYAQGNRVAIYVERGQEQNVRSKLRQMMPILKIEPESEEHFTDRVRVFGSKNDCDFDAFGAHWENERENLGEPFIAIVPNFYKRFRSMGSFGNIALTAIKTKTPLVIFNEMSVPTWSSTSRQGLTSSSTLAKWADCSILIRPANSGGKQYKDEILRACLDDFQNNKVIGVEIVFCNRDTKMNERDVIIKKAQYRRKKGWVSLFE